MSGSVTASIWEIAIKHLLGRGVMPISGHDALRYFLESGYRQLPIETEHVVAVEDLPGHHSGLFDRILVAQPLIESMRRMTHDGLVSLYSDTSSKFERSADRPHLVGAIPKHWFVVDVA
jgi:PIN domain nuclease of toxin-antitoxin system